jgi:uncharacterized protein (DUF2252 family)
VLASLCVALALSCGDASEDAREDEIASVLAQADEPILRARPALTAGKYGRMASSPFEFLRGSLALYRHDARAGTTQLAVSRFALDLPLVPSLGDPHFENFATLRASDKTLGLEPNDFDAADRAPYLWDLQRLTSACALAALQANADDAGARARSAAAARDIARAVVVGYRAAIERAASGAPPERVVSTSHPTSPILADVFSRADRDEAIRRELNDFTDLSATTPTVRRLKRGGVDPADAQSVFLDVPPFAYAQLPAAIEQWRREAVAPPPPEELVLIDAVRELGSGVASWPRIRMILLVRGPTDDPKDDRLLELKELTDSGIAGLYPPGVHHDNVGLRIVETSRAAWARPDAEPQWGSTTLLGLPFQIRAETQGQKNIRLSRMVGARGTPEAITELATVLGGILARVHTSGADGLTNARAIYGRITADPEGFADEQADAGVAYARQTLDDYPRFRSALARRGFALGVPFDPADAPRADFAAVLGTPPPHEELSPVP